MDRQSPFGVSNRELAQEALDWAIGESPIRIPKPISDPYGWAWDAFTYKLYAITSEGHYTFRIRLSKTRRPICLLSVKDDQGQVEWEAPLPDHLQKDV